MFFTKSKGKNGIEGFDIQAKHLRAILAPFNRLLHCATPWTGARACFGSYVDQNVLFFFFHSTCANGK